MLLLENDLYELEATVERLRGQAANRQVSLRCAFSWYTSHCTYTRYIIFIYFSDPTFDSRETRVNMADIERIAMVLSKSSKTVADWKLKFPILQDTMKVKLASEMEKVRQVVWFIISVKFCGDTHFTRTAMFSGCAQRKNVRGRAGKARTSASSLQEINWDFGYAQKVLFYKILVVCLVKFLEFVI